MDLGTKKVNENKKITRLNILKNSNNLEDITKLKPIESNVKNNITPNFKHKESQIKTAKRNNKSASKYESSKSKNSNISVVKKSDIIILILSIFLCILLGYLFIVFASDFLTMKVIGV